MQDSSAVPATRPEEGGRSTTVDRAPLSGSPTTDLASAPPAIPGFEVRRVLGRGGMAVVYEAWQASLRRRVAIKVLDPELTGPGHLAARFEYEATHLAGLSHPNVVTVFDRGQVEDSLYLVMEYVDGGSLRELLGPYRIPLPPLSVAAVMLQVARALEYIHLKGLVHRDVKPANLLVSSDDVVKLTDFGLAGLLAPPEDRRRLTAQHMVMGTLDYMAPEQRTDARNVDHRADVYSFGITTYELLTGEVPTGAWRPPGERVPGIDPRLDRLVLGCLARDPARRIGSARELVAALEEITAGVDQDAVPSPRSLAQASSQVLWAALDTLSLAPEPIDPDRTVHRAAPAAPSGRRVRLGAGLALLAATAILGPGARPEAPEAPPLLAMTATMPEPAPAPREATLLLRGVPGDARARLVDLDQRRPPRTIAAGRPAGGIAPGTYRLELSAAGHQPFGELVELVGGQQLVYRYRLDVVPAGEGSLQVSVDPATATVSCLDCPPGLQAPGPVGEGWSMRLPPGSYRLRLAAPGFLPREEPVVVTRGQSTSLGVALRPIPAPAPPPASPEPPAMAVGKGRVEIRTEPPGALVTVGEDALGESPVTRELAPGRYQVRVELVGHEPLEADLRVTAGEVAKLSWPLARARGVLEIRSEPSGAEVWLDGARVGTTPLAGLEYPFGAVAVELRHPLGVRWKRLVLLQAGKRELVVAKLVD